jgi:hypothetical protein
MTNIFSIASAWNRVAILCDLTMRRDQQDAFALSSSGSRDIATPARRVDGDRVLHPALGATVD